MSSKIDFEKHSESVRLAYKDLMALILRGENKMVTEWARLHATERHEIDIWRLTTRLIQGCEAILDEIEAKRGDLKREREESK